MCKNLAHNNKVETKFWSWVMVWVPTRGVKIFQNPGPAPDRNRIKLDGPRIHPSIHIRARYQAWRYIPLALGYY